MESEEELQRLRHGIAAIEREGQTLVTRIAMLHERIAPGKAKADATMVALRNAVPLRPSATGVLSRAELRRVHVSAERVWSDLVREEAALTARVDGLAAEWQERTKVHRLLFQHLAAAITYVALPLPGMMRRSRPDHQGIRCALRLLQLREDGDRVRGVIGAQAGEDRRQDALCDEGTGRAAPRHAREPLRGGEVRATFLDRCHFPP